MKNTDITDPLFLEAVNAIDAGNTPLLKKLLDDHPRLIHDRLIIPGQEDGYFKSPYLLWFVADNPIRHEKLPPNIVAVTELLIQVAKREKVSSLQEQLNYTLGLVSTGRVPRESGVQIALMDLLIDAGAQPGGGNGALAHGNIEAASHLIERGGKLTLTTAVGLGRMNDVIRLTAEASVVERQVALVAAAFYGKTDLLAYLISLGIDINAYPSTSSGFHSHATALHQAVYSGSLEAVKLLIEAGARIDIKDKVYEGTPLDWAEYMQREEGVDESMKKKYAVIEDYLRKQSQ